VYDIENLTLSVGYSQIKQTNYDLKINQTQGYNAGIGYSYSSSGKSYTPFKGMAATKGVTTMLMKDFNYSLMPSQLTFRSDLNRQLTTTQYYESGPLTPVQSIIYQKSYVMTRNYGMLWNFTKSIATSYKANVYAMIDEPDGTPGTSDYKATVTDNLKKLGRMKNFDQNVTLTYKLPLDKIKALNWTNMDYTYAGGYIWTSGALVQRDTLGNAIKNTRDNTINAKIDLDKLYSKSKFLAEMKKVKPPIKKSSELAPKTKDTIPPPPDRTLMKAVFKTLMMIKNANLTYSTNDYTNMYGFMPTPKYGGFGDTTGGKTFNHADIMLPFLVGSQDPSFRQKASDVGWVSNARSINQPFTQSHTNTISARANVEPLKDFKITLEAKLTSGNIYTELYRVRATGSNEFVSDNPTRSGNYSVSAITILSSFDKHVSGSVDPNSSVNFEKFKAYRTQIANELNAGGTGSEYGENSQAVLLPAFLAAYTGKDVNKVESSGIPKIPLPGWQIDYAGLAKIKPLAKKFQSITLSHKYSSQYLVGSYASSLIYNSNYITPGANFYDSPKVPYLIDSATKQVVPIYVISGVSVNEAFAPFIGFNARTKNKISYKFTYSRTRTLNMSLTNAQLTESLNNSWQIGIGYARSNVHLPKFLGGTTLKNELNVQVNFTLNDMITYQRKFIENTTITAGNTNLQFKPTVSYNISQRVTMQFYFERTINTPKISSSYRRATTAIGIQLRFTLS
jgi:cell surface protein SprA